MAGYKIEFPDFPPETMPEIPAGFLDASWHNDSCPSFLNQEAGLCIFVDYADSELREFFDGNLRFNVFEVDASGYPKDSAAFASDEWPEVLNFIATHSAN